MKIKDLQKEEKPREKLTLVGPENLTDVELLSIILRSGGKDVSVTDLSRSLLEKFGNMKNLLSSDIQELLNYPNVDIAKATSIKALEEISRRYVKNDCTIHNPLKTPHDVYETVRKDILGKDQEYLILITLDSRNRLISKDVISKGTVNETLIHPREIFKKALSKNAISIILVHNHPSGVADPSNEDIKVTKRIFNAGMELGIPLKDHLVVTDNDYVSLKAGGLINF